MSKTKIAVAKPRKSLARGLLAGLVGGLAGAVAMTLAERLIPQPAPSEPESPDRAVAVETVRWGFGAAVGAAYGVVAEFYPSATAKEGASFGMALEALSHEGALPALGFLMKPQQNTAQGFASGITSHVVYGVTTEVVRGFIRKRL
jgi:putative membrane protein